MTGTEAGLFLTMLLATAPIDQQREAAFRASARALYVEAEAGQTLKRLERRYVSDDLRQLGGAMGLIYRLGVERKIAYTWRF